MIRVDHGKWPLGRMKMCHLIADSPEELREAARKLGLEHYIQYPRTWKEHLDISQSKKAQAIRELGAQQITGRELALILRQRREAGLPGP